MRMLFVLIVLLVSPLLDATEIVEPDETGEVRLPLHRFTDLLDRSEHESRSAPASYAIGNAIVRAVVADQDDRSSGQVVITATIETFEDEWTLVPLLAPGTALTYVHIDGEPVQLVQGPDGLSWSTDQAGVVSLELGYGVDARRSPSGFVLPLPVPRAAAMRLELEFPDTDLDLAVVPASDLRIVEEAGVTRVGASIPGVSSIMVSWRTPGKQPYVMSRARYQGELQGGALVWNAEYDVELFTGELVTLPLMPAGVTLSDLYVDSEKATVLEEAGRFATVLQGRGKHKVYVEFQVPLQVGKGPPRARLQIPRVPVSRFDLSLPGKKEIKVEPASNVVTRSDEQTTQATVFMPMSDSVVFSWIEAVPDDLRARVRANASLYHVIHAEEGVLHGRALVAYEITHGATNQLELELPADAQVNRIVSPGGAISDWAVAKSENDERKTINVFLDREVKGDFVLDVTYERLLGASERASNIVVPLLSALNVHRQRGMVALLASSELVLTPVEEERVSRVGENQLPAFVRNQLDLNVAHTYKYTDGSPLLSVVAAAPVRKQGKFDAQVDTLVSIGEVTMRGAAGVEVNVKSGAIVDLQLRLPEGVNILGVSGPSLRTHEIGQGAGEQTIDIEFTQEMEGQFRIDVNYELIMTDGADDVVVPTVSVAEAEVEHGRIAIEALTAVEVRASVAEQLSTLDANELPQQLVLKTTNPILLAFKYVQVQPPFKLALKITRHKEIDVQVAAIERADYRTLFTGDGLAVTTARFIIRNSRRQFLRLELPEDSQVWSVFANGKPEKPAHASDGSAVLIKMINSGTGFPVDVVYATPVDAMGALGNISSHLPRPDMVVTNTRWDVFLPASASYHRPDSNMDVVVDGQWANPSKYGAEIAQQAGAAQLQQGQPLRINVPTRGVHFAFEKLYANQSEERAGFSIAYTSREAGRLGLWLSVAATVLIWLGIVALGSRRRTFPRAVAIAVFVVGLVLLLGSMIQLGADPAIPSALSMVIALLIGLWLLVQRIRNWRQSRNAV